MKLRRVTIRHFRKLADPVCIEGIGDGLTLVAGANEEGKSTVLAALRAGLFDSAGLTGEARDGFNPVGRTGVPAVELDFELGGAAFRLRKIFRKLGTVLETPAGMLQGEPAEDRLRELLRFVRPGRGSAQPQHQGLQAVFWVDQGTTFSGFDLLAHGRERFATALEAEVGGVVLGEQGRRLTQHARDRLRRLQDERGRPRGDRARLAERLAELAAEIGELVAREGSFEERLEALDDRRRSRAALLARDALGVARQARAREEAAQAELAELRRREAAGRDTLLAAQAELGRLDARRREREVWRQQLRELAERRAAAIEDCHRLAADRAALERQLEAARLAEAAAEDLVRTTASMVEAAGRAAERASRATLLTGLEAELAALTMAQAAVEGVVAGLRANPATADRLATVRDAGLAAREAAARLEVTATRVELQPGPAARALLGGVAMDPAVPLTVTEPIELELVPFGRIRIVPGGADLPARRRAQREAGERLRNALAALGAGSLAEAEALAVQRRQLETAEREARTRIALCLAGHGLADVEALRERIATFRAELTDPICDEAVDPVAVAELEERLARARDAQAASRVELRALEQRQASLQAEQARLQGALEAMAIECHGLEARVEGELALLSEPLLAAQREAAALRFGAAEAALQAVSRDLAGRDPEAVAERLRVAERRCADLESDSRRLDAEILGLEHELRGMGADSFGERLEELRGAAELARAELDRLNREARAWQLVVQELEAAAAAARDALVEPVRQRLRPLLGQLWPGAEPLLDAGELNLKGLRRDGLEEPLARLSIGTREQLAVLLRLALAKLLLDREGEAPCLILDDALVYADEERFERMKIVLQRAARELQILVLTCRPRDYLGMDARLVRLEDCRDRSVAA